MSLISRPLVVLLWLAVSGGCTSGGGGGGVPWGDYSPSVRSTIDSLGAVRDCSGLQAQFDAADANNQSTMARVGHNNAELMRYINTKMQAASC